MRDRGGELADARDLRGARQLQLHVAQGLRGSFELGPGEPVFGHLHRGADVLHELAGVVDDRVRRRVLITDAAVGEPVAVVAEIGSLFAEGALPHRLHPRAIRVPPLRERLDDIPLLVKHFVEEFVSRHGKHVTDIPNEVLETLMQGSWPGNVRELQNVIERAVISTRDGVLRIPSEEGLCSARPSSSLADVTREHILAVLAETNWVVGGPRGAAARLGLCRTTLLAKMQRLGIAR